MLHQLGRQLRGFAQARLQLDHRHYSLAPFLVGHPDRGHVSDRWVLEEHGVDLGRVDVHAARNDQIGTAVGQEQVAVMVHVAHVAEGEVLPPVGGLRLLDVLEVLEPTDRRCLQVDVARLAGW